MNQNSTLNIIVFFFSLDLDLGYTKYLTLNCVINNGGIHVGALVAKSLLAHYALINGTLGIPYKQIL